MPGRIEGFALLGDLHTAALVARDGSIDRLCVPRFDAGVCFAALLHDDSASRWPLAPTAGGAATDRRYRGDSLILESTWITGDGSVRVVDCMPVRSATRLVRVVEGVSGAVPMRFRLTLRFDYGRRRASVGPTPQAFSLVGLINAARHLSGAESSSTKPAIGNPNDTQ